MAKETNSPIEEDDDSGEPSMMLTIIVVALLSPAILLDKAQNALVDFIFPERDDDD